MKKEPKISKVIIWSNGMVVVFDQDGKQMGNFQGKFEDKKVEILEEIGDRNDVEFFTGAWEKDVSKISKETFTRL